MDQSGPYPTAATKWQIIINEWVDRSIIWILLDPCIPPLPPHLQLSEWVNLMSIKFKQNVHSWLIDHAITIGHWRLPRSRRKRVNFRPPKINVFIEYDFCLNIAISIYLFCNEFQGFIIIYWIFCPKMAILKLVILIGHGDLCVSVRRAVPSVQTTIFGQVLRVARWVVNVLP